MGKKQKHEKEEDTEDTGGAKEDTEVDQQEVTPSRIDVMLRGCFA